MRQLNRDQTKIMTTSSPSTAGDSSINYAKAESYWSSVTPSVDGMLGGFASLSTLDVRHSTQTLTRLRDEYGMRTTHALDCGSGIGRVTKELLLPLFERVSMVDVTPSFIESSAEYLGADNARVDEKMVLGLQDVHPAKDKYDCVWVQWVAGHLTDVDFRAFFKLCAENVREGGVVVLKENTTKNVEPDVDEEVGDRHS